MFLASELKIHRNSYPDAAVNRINQNAPYFRTMIPLQKFYLVLILGFPAFITSCSPSWSGAEKAKLSTFSVAPVRGMEGGSQDIIGQRQAGIDAGAAGGALGNGSFGSGFAIAAAISLLDSLAISQKPNGSEEYRSYLRRIEREMPTAIESKVSVAVKSKLKRHQFFGPRLRSQSDNRLVITINEVRYQPYVPSSSVILRDSNLVVPVIAGSAILRTSDGDLMFSRDIVGEASAFSGTAYSLSQDPRLVRRGFAAAIDAFAEDLQKKLSENLSNRSTMKWAADPDPQHADAASSDIVQLKAIYYMRVGKTAPYHLTQGYNSLLRRPSTKFTAGGKSYKMAATSDGKVVYFYDLFNTYSTTKPSAAYRNIRAKLQANGIRILRQRDATVFNAPHSFFLELDGNGYEALQR